MKFGVRRGVAALALLLAPALAYGQGAPVYQSGSITPGHLSKFWNSGLIGDVGGIYGDANGNGVAPFAVKDNNGPGVCSNTAATGGQYNALCFGHDSSGNGLITLDSYGGLTNKTAYFRKNGQNYEIPFTTGGAVGPGTTVVPHLPVWNNTNGTLLADSGYAFFTPEDYGAVGDGATNDSTAMQNAINAAQALKATLWLGPKTYMATDLLISGPMRLQGSGWFSSEIKNPTAGASSNIIKVGYTAPTASQTQGVVISDLAIGGNSPTGGWGISQVHVANTITRNVFFDSTFCGIEMDQVNTAIIENLWGYTVGNGCAAVKFWVDATAQASGGRSDGLYASNIAFNNGYYGNDGFWWRGMANTVNAQHLVFLQSKRGLFIDAAQNDVSHFPAFATITDLQIEGAQDAACQIDGGRYFYFFNPWCYNVPGVTGPGGSQGNADTAALWIKPDGTASITSSITISGGSIGIAQKEAAIIQAQGVYLDATQFRGSSLSAANTYPSLRLKFDGVNGSADYVLSNIKFCGVFGDTVQNNYGIIREAGVGQTIVTAANFTYCQVGEMQDNAADRLVMTASTDRNGKSLPESKRVFISNAAPTLSDDCAGANAAIEATSNNVQGTIGVAAGAPVKTTCTITFASTNAAANNGIGNLRAAFFAPPSGASGVFFVNTAATANSISFQRSDGGDLSGFTIPYVVFPEK